jgi:hypothetical protein
MGIWFTLMENVLGLGINLITEPGFAVEFVIGPISILIGNVDALDDWSSLPYADWAYERRGAVYPPWAH